MKSRWILVLCVSVLGALIGTASPAQATSVGYNGLVAYAAQNGDRLDIFTVAPWSGEVQNLTADLDVASQNCRPAWSPDGTQIAFVSTGSDTCFDSAEIYMVNADGTDLRNLTKHPATDVDPAWSPDGTKISFSSKRDGGADTEIYVANANGNGPVSGPLTNNEKGDTSSTWSPDGTQIAFESNREAGWGIYVMNANGSHQVRVTHKIANPDLEKNRWPDWSPDGSRIVFTEILYPQNGEKHGYDTVMTMDPTGADLQALSDKPADANTSNVDARWSPDGQQIVYSRQHQLWVMDRDGANKAQLTNPSTTGQVPSWQPVLGLWHCGKEQMARNAAAATGRQDGQVTSADVITIAVARSGLLYKAAQPAVASAHETVAPITQAINAEAVIC